MNDLRKDQITKMARALIDNAIIPMDGDFTPYCFCNFCNAEQHGKRYSAKDLKHDIDCPVLIAKEVLKDVYDINYYYYEHPNNNGVCNFKCKYYDIEE